MNGSVAVLFAMTWARSTASRYLQCARTCAAGKWSFIWHISTIINRVTQPRRRNTDGRTLTAEWSCCRALTVSCSHSNCCRWHPTPGCSSYHIAVLTKMFLFNNNGNDSNNYDVFLSSAPTLIITIIITA